MHSGSSDLASSEMRGASAPHHPSDAVRTPAAADGQRERGPAAFPPDDLAARFFAKLGVLARFGLASHTRLLLETPRQES